MPKKPQNVLGWDSYPTIGSYYRREPRFNIFGFFNEAVSQPMVPVQRIPVGLDTPGNTLRERSRGSYNRIPPRELVAQTRLKNKQYELPSYGFTHNPDGAPYLLRVPAIPGQVHYMATVNNYTTQPEFLQPITNLQIHNDINLLSQVRSAIFGQAQQIQQQQNLQTMFPSIYGGQAISVGAGN